MGQRVKHLRYRGAPLRDDQPLRLAINNYRSAGSGGYTMFRNAKVVWRSGRDIRDLMVEYFGERRRLPEKADGNWRLVPPRAVETLGGGGRERAVTGESLVPRARLTRRGSALMRAFARQSLHRASATQGR